MHSPALARPPSAQAAGLPRPAACPAPARAQRPHARAARACCLPPARLPACLPARPSACPPARPACCRAPACAPNPAPHVRPAPSAHLRPPARPAARPAPACALLRAQSSSCVPCHCYSGRIVAWLGTVLQYSPTLPSPLLTIQLYCIATQIELAYAAIHLSPVTVLQYSLLSQHLSCNTKWAVAHQNFLLKIFFSFFIINDFFFSFISRNWKNL